MMNDKFISLNDVFSDEDTCSMCAYGEATPLDIPTLCWEHYINLSETTAEAELDRDEAYFRLV
jgi:hypothetical protein